MGVLARELGGLVNEPNFFAHAAGSRGVDKARHRPHPPESQYTHNGDHKPAPLNRVAGLPVDALLPGAAHRRPRHRRSFTRRSVAHRRDADAARRQPHPRARVLRAHKRDHDALRRQRQRRARAELPPRRGRPLVPRRLADCRPAARDAGDAESAARLAGARGASARTPRRTQSIVPSLLLAALIGLLRAQRRVSRRPPLRATVPPNVPCAALQDAA